MDFVNEAHPAESEKREGTKQRDRQSCEQRRIDTEEELGLCSSVSIVVADLFLTQVTFLLHSGNSTDLALFQKMLLEFGFDVV